MKAEDAGRQEVESVNDAVKISSFALIDIKNLI